MAVMKNNRPTDFEGEQLVWDCIKQYLPDEVICYTHRETKGKEFDFCLLIKDIGLIIIEVKGWNKTHILKVLSSNEIVLKGDKIVGSPKHQARKYQFNLLGIFKDKYSINPAIYNMVCYPFMSEFDYKSVGLNIVSEPEFTLFNEDITDKNRFSKKIVEMIKAIELKNFDRMNGKIYDICRRHFEIDYKFETIASSFSYYSVVNIFNHKLSLAEISEIISSYINGTKHIIFIDDTESIEILALQLSNKLNELHIAANGNNLAFSEDIINDIKVKNNHFSIFNFEVFGVEKGYIYKDDIINNGIINDEQDAFLDKMQETVNFNKQQYNIEHAEINRDIYVKAGAGTGKTYSMISRIAFLFHPSSKSEIYLPHEDIAMLTFTAKAAVNMKVRLKSLFMNYFLLTRNVNYLEVISNVEKMQISTIHSFAKRIIQNTSLPLGIGTNFTTVSGIYDKRNIFNRLFNEYLKQKNAQDKYFFDKIPIPLYDFQKMLMKIPEMLYNKGYDIKTAKIEAFGKDIETIPFINEIIEKVLIETEKEYAKMLFENNCVNLNEYMIYLDKCINDRSFNKNLFKFKYLFVDEFQDTDDAQISSFLSMQEKLKFSFFIVGDLKQSIYRFRGATMGAFEQMGCYSDKWLFFTLNINYRSDRRLLNLYDNLFLSMGKDELIPFTDKEDNLSGVKENDAYSKNELIEHFDYKKAIYGKDVFYKDLFERVKKEKDKIDNIARERNLSEPEKTIAILTRSNYEIANILKYAKKYNIEIDSDSSGDLYKLPPAIDLCKLTSALCNPYNVIYLFDLIHSNYINAEFASINGIKDKSEDEKKAILIDFLDEFFMNKLDKKWSQIICDVQNKPVLMMLKIIYDKLQPWVAYSSNLERQEFYRTNYELVFEELSNDNKKSYITLETINENLHIFIQTGTEKKSRSFDYINDEARVICTTVHKSKGLEYGTVILPFTSKSISEIQRNAVDVVIMNDKIGYCMIEYSRPYANEYYSFDMEKKEKSAEESRILYVALTRAINNFIYFRNIECNDLSWGTILEGLNNVN